MTVHIEREARNARKSNRLGLAGRVLRDALAFPVEEGKKRPKILYAQRFAHADPRARHQIRAIDEHDSPPMIAASGCGRGAWRAGARSAFIWVQPKVRVVARYRCRRATICSRKALMSGAARSGIVMKQRDVVWHRPSDEPFADVEPPNES